MLFFSVASNAQVLWHQTFDECSDWAPTNQKTGTGLSETHSDAVSRFNATTYRLVDGYPTYADRNILEVTGLADRNGTGKGLAYKFYPDDDWLAASIDINLHDADISWVNTPNSDGEDELWYSVWWRIPNELVWYDDECTPEGFQLWKQMRMYGYVAIDVISYINTRNGTSYTELWDALVAENVSISSHYLWSDISGCSTPPQGTEGYYKPVAFIGAWYAQSMESQLSYYRESDGCLGTSGFPSESNRTDSDSHFINAKNFWYDCNTQYSGHLSDHQWHLIEYHVKLNTIGNADGVYEIYVDRVKLNHDANGLENRADPNIKLHEVILFDNYYQAAGENGVIYIDDPVISTTRLADDYFASSSGLIWYLDADGDGWPEGTTQQAESDPGATWYELSELSGTTLDCNDADPAINPGASDSSCDGVDQDCSGADYCQNLTQVSSSGTSVSIGNSGTTIIVGN